MKKVYLDNAATTPVDKEVMKAMLPYFEKNFGNPSALYKEGVAAQKSISEARKIIAEFLHTQPDTIIFASGGTESDNLGIFGTIFGSPEKKHIISIGIEHDAVLKPLQKLKKEGWDVTFITVSKEGLIDPKRVIEAIRPETVLITIMYANNEIGTIEPIHEIGRLLLRFKKEHNSIYPYFHTDACQATNFLEMDVEKLHVDLLTFNGSKIYGPKGIGVLFLRRGVKFDPQLVGGSQEKNRRAGTENVPLIVGLGKAVQIVSKNKSNESARLMKLSQYFLEKLKKEIPEIILNGPKIGENRLPNNVNITIPGNEGEAMLLYLDSLGISCSTASACNTEGLDTSHVLSNIGVSKELANSTLRFTLGRETKKTELDYVVRSLKSILGKVPKIA